ncbi:MAG: type I-C CRISPR-associated protein Cas7/Csd2 [Nitrospirota bacterium]
MTMLQNKIDFAVVLRVKRANPNGDPLNGNRPRTDYDNYGEMTDVCNKRKIRDRLLERWVAAGKKEDDGNEIFVQSDDRKEDECKSLRARAEAGLGNKLGSTQTVELACKKWLDVRAFGQLFALKGGKKARKGEESEGEGDTGISIGIRGPVTVQSGFSVAPVDIASTQITKSVSGEDTKDGKRSSDTMGTKHRVENGVYVFFGSMNPQLAQKTGFSDVDAEAIKQVLPRLFENDESSARPAGSMEVLKVIWWRHNCKAGQYSSAKVHRTLAVGPDGSIDLSSLNGLTPEVIDGF